MQYAEYNLNPFFKYEEEDEAYFDDKGMNNTSQMFAYSSNLSGMFEHLYKKREQDAVFSNMNVDQNTGRGDGRDIDLDII